MTKRWTVRGRDPSPDGYHDDLLYEGSSKWQVLKAFRACQRDGLTAKITRHGHSQTVVLIWTAP